MNEQQLRAKLEDAARLLENAKERENRLRGEMEGLRADRDKALGEANLARQETERWRKDEFFQDKFNRVDQAAAKLQTCIGKLQQRLKSAGEIAAIQQKTIAHLRAKVAELESQDEIPLSTIRRWIAASIAPRVGPGDLRFWIDAGVGAMAKSAADTMCRFPTATLTPTLRRRRANWPNSSCRQWARAIMTSQTFRIRPTHIASGIGRIPPDSWACSVRRLAASSRSGSTTE